MKFKMPWRKIEVCVVCEKRITHFANINSNGYCPYCGLKRDYILFCNTKSIIYRKEIEITGLQFWKPKVKYIGADYISNDYLDQNKRN